MNKISRRMALMTLALLALQAPSWAGPPFVTDDPEPVDYRHWEVYIAGNLFQTQAGTTGSAPEIEVNYGALPDVQLHVIATTAFNTPAGFPSQYGIGDTELGAKFRFIKETEGFPQAAVFPLVELPTGNESRGLWNGNGRFFIPVWFQKSWGPWTSYGGGGYWFNPGKMGNQDWVFVGWAVQRDLSPVVTLGGEAFFQTPALAGGQDSVGGNLGLILNLDDHNHPMISIGRDVINTVNTLTGYAAYQWTF